VVIEPNAPASEFLAKYYGEVRHVQVALTKDNHRRVLRDDCGSDAVVRALALGGGALGCTAIEVSPPRGCCLGCFGTTCHCCNAWWTGNGRRVTLFDVGLQIARTRGTSRGCDKEGSTYHSRSNGVGVVATLSGRLGVPPVRVQRRVEVTFRSMRVR
jgi:hypothetical protein